MLNFKGAKCFSIEFRDCDLKGADFMQATYSITLAVECISAQHLSQVVIYSMQIIDDSVSKSVTDVVE